MHVDHSIIADQPNVLELSLADKLVPRWDFLCLLAQRQNASHSEQPARLVLRHNKASELKFAKEFNDFERPC